MFGGLHLERPPISSAHPIFIGFVFGLDSYIKIYGLPLSKNSMQYLQLLFVLGKEESDLVNSQRILWFTEIKNLCVYVWKIVGKVNIFLEIKFDF